MGGKNNKRQRATCPDRDGQPAIEGIKPALSKMYATLNCRTPSGPTLPFTEERTEAHELLKPYSHLTAIQFRYSPRQQTLVFSFSAHSLEELKFLEK